MIKPDSLKKDSTILIASPSNGLKKEKKIKSLETLIDKFKSNNFKVLEDSHTRESINGASSTVQKRAKELEEAILNKDIDYILSVSGGDYFLEVLDFIDLDIIKDNIKWLQGHSDITPLLFLTTTKYDIQTIYSFNAANMGSVSNDEFNNNLNILKGEKISQKDFINYPEFKEKKPWTFQKDINLKGKMIGGYLGCLIDILGTKYDCTLDFIEKYKEEGIIWYFDIDYISMEDLFRDLWHLRNAGWFKYTKCILFGRSEEESFTGITIDEAILRGLGDLKIQYVTNFDLGHTNPRITIVNGSNVEIICNSKIHEIKMI